MEASILTTLHLPLFRVHPETRKWDLTQTLVSGPISSDLMSFTSGLSYFSDTSAANNQASGCLLLAGTYA